jgi:hypothetical protein
VEGNPFFAQETDMSREIPKPFLIAKHEDGAFRLTLRNTRFNSWGYPLTDSTPVDESFKSAAAARAHAKEHYGAEAGQFASK